ncbi:MAG: hypothetical protein QG553_380 [Patescibacteria group bacterium]|nr:hypothetical protein [Patescibacteria group bacterium]
MAAKKSQRIGALIAALFFLVASLATSVAVIWTMTQESNNKKDAEKVDTTSQSSNQTLANFTPSSDPVTELKITDTKVGDGAEAKAGSTVSVTYTGALVKDGSVFDSSSEPISLSLSQVIKGWQDGIPGMKVGGSRRLIIPANLAYGDQSPTPAIPPNSALVFDVTLTAVQ